MSGVSQIGGGSAVRLHDLALERLPHGISDERAIVRPEFVRAPDPFDFYLLARLRRRAWFLCPLTLRVVRCRAVDMRLCEVGLPCSVGYARMRTPGRTTMMRRL